MAGTFPEPPSDGQRIRIENGRAVDVPKKPVIVAIAGDGIGGDIFPAMQMAVNAAVMASGAGEGGGIAWHLVPAGEAASEEFGAPLPDQTVKRLASSHRAMTPGGSMGSGLAMFS